jgi:chromosome segregation ATPase
VSESTDFPTGLTEIQQAKNRGEATRRVLARRDDAIGALRAELAQTKRDRNQLYEQVKEFREKCDPREDVVFCTAAEIHGFSFGDPDV